MKNSTFIFPYVASISLVAFILTFNHLKGDFTQDFIDKTTLSKEEQTTGNGSSQSCNLFSGKWVYDDKSHPPYNGTQCSFMFDEYACEKYWRKDLKYQQWRWQPDECDLPRLNGTVLLEKLSGKKLFFVGDSVEKNQWSSMLCLLESSLPPSSLKSHTLEGNLFISRALEYNSTIGFYWSPFLVESNNDDPIMHREKRVIRIDAIEKHAVQWTDADILIFASFAWWSEPNITLLWGSFGSSDAIYETVEMNLRFFGMALNTWSDWLENRINRTRTKLYFMSASPTHFHWGSHKCYNETEPILSTKYRGVNRDRGMMEVAESTIQKLDTRGLKVQYLNITQLSDYRKDAHPSIYRKFYHPLTESQLTNPKSYSDCLHWCLPGVPDVWNQILYASLMNS